MPLGAATFTVVNGGGAGPGTLRQAILDANDLPGKDFIRFAIPGAGPHKISLRSGLPQISDPVEIDGSSQPGYAGHPLIEVDGSLAGQVSGLLILGGDSVVRGLCLNGFQEHGINIESGGGNLIEGNFIGTDVLGKLALGNGGAGITVFQSTGNVLGGTHPASRNVLSGNVFGVYIEGDGASGNRIEGNWIGTDESGLAGLGNQLDGVYLHDAPGNTVGGSDAQARNLISGNDQSGILVWGSGATGNLVQGNYLGTDRSGKTALGNGADGISIVDASGNQVGGAAPGAGNLISGNALNGLGIYGTAASNNLVQGNFIGVDVAGTIRLGNGFAGVGITNGPNNVVGGILPGAGNLISGNGDSGLALWSGASATLIQGNFVGTDLLGAAALGNAQGGIYLYGVSNCLIGGTQLAAGNVISGNSKVGISIGDPGATGNRILGNSIGVMADGLSALGNQWHNVEILNAASFNVIGGRQRGAANRIAFAQTAGYDGIRMRNGCVGNRIQGNSIFSNSGLGIDLGIDGVTPNDPGDPDEGANRLQNHPILASASGRYRTTVMGSLDSLPNTPMELDFYESPEADPTGYGEGQTWIGSWPLATDSAGHAAFSAILTNAAPVTGYISATATDPEGNTSEFSPCVKNATALVIDTDGDGLPDDYEPVFGLDGRNPSDGAGDADGDGLTNLDEFRAGTDPHDPADGLRIVAWQGWGNRLRLGFPTVFGRGYSVEAAPALEGKWTELGAPVLGHGGVAWVWIAPNPSGGEPPRFFRVKLRR